MALTSPWSRLIAERLTSLGLDLHLVDLQPRGNENLGYLNSGAAAATDSVSTLEAQVASVHRVLPPVAVIPRLLYSARALRRIARKSGADIVLSLYGGSLAAASYLSGVRPYIVYVVGSDVLLANWFERQMARLTLPAAATVIANGKFLAARTRDLVPKASVSVLYMGSDLERFSYSPRAAIPSFVCTRGFLPVYDNATIIRALGRLGAVPPQFAFSFLSSGPLLAESVTLADQLIPAAWRKGVVFHGGVSDTAVRDALQSASHYLSASLSDGASSSLFEAMACGLFPIVSDIPANREWITDQKNGLLFSPGDDSYLAECIRRAIAGEPWMAKARDANRRLVEERANIDVSMRAMVDLLASHSIGLPHK